MPEHLRALVVIIVLSTVVFAFAKAPACAVAMSPADFTRRRNLWIGVTLVAFLAHNFWIYIVVSGAMLLITIGREKNRVALFFFMLFALPPIEAEITGLGLIRFLFSIDYIRLLLLTVLLPTFFALQKERPSLAFGHSLIDKCVAGYVVLNIALIFTATTFTNTLRQGVFYTFIDIFLPYYVVSRSVKNVRDFRDASMALVVAALLLSAIGLFEFVRHWSLYKSLERGLGVYWNYGGYLNRGDALRAQASSGTPIALGYAIVVASGFALYLQKFVPNRMMRTLGGLLLLGGVLAPLSRGPWVGFAAMILVFIALGPTPIRGFVSLGFVSLLLVPLVVATDIGASIMNYLPFVGKIDVENITYRQRLFEVAVDAIIKNPLFGAFDYIYSPAFQELKQGDYGIIDLVNSYAVVGLSSGLIGLGLFCGAFAAVVVGVVKAMRTVGDKNTELYRLGQALTATMVAILVIIATVSSVTIIPLVYWSVAGLGAAYMRMAGTAEVPVKAVTSGQRAVTSRTAVHISSSRT